MMASSGQSQRGPIDLLCLPSMVSSCFGETLLPQFVLIVS